MPESAPRPGQATLAGWLIIGGSVILVFTAWPILYSAYLSLTDYDVINDPTFVGLDNYREMAQDPKVALSLWNTLVYTVVQVPLYTVVGRGQLMGPPTSSGAPV